MSMKRSMAFVIIFLILNLNIVSNERLIPFRLNGKIGFIDENHKYLLAPEYEGTVSDYSKNMVLIDCKGYAVLIGENGHLLTRGVDSIFIIGNDEYAVSQKGGNGVSRIFSSDNKVKHTYDGITILKTEKSANVLIIDDFDEVYGARRNILNQDGIALFKNNSFKRIFAFDSVSKVALIQDIDFNDCLVTTDGKIINQLIFQFGMRSLGDGLVFGKNTRTGESGFYNMDCKLVIKAAQKSGSDMDDWNCYPSVTCGVVPLVNDGKQNILLSEWQTQHSDNWCVVDKSGMVLANGITADYIYPFSDNVAVIKLRSSEKWIYRLIDKKGKIITTTDYDEINSSVNGYCMAKKDGIDYLIRSKDGKVFKCADFK